MVAPLSFAELATESGSQLFVGREHGADVSFFVNHAAPGRGVAPHRHPYPEIFVIQGGEAAFVVDGERVATGAGHVVVVPAGAVHEFVNTGNEALEMVSIHPVPAMETEWVEQPGRSGG
jgi:mannose-6-phosphate isomerase-like protein (cupin superfamily)